MITTIIVDDEPNNTRFVSELLCQYFKTVEILAVCNDANEAMLLIDELRPRLVFLDVEMPGLNGFELLQKLEPLGFEVIFITAYNQYAVQAFDVHAAGYITKPIELEKFIKVTGEAIQKIEKDEINSHLFSMLHSNRNKIALPTQSGLIFINPADILYCSSSGNYTKFFIKDNKTILVSRQLGEFEKLLPAADFHRIHDQYLVNLNYIKEYIRGRGGELVMENSDTLPVSAKRKDAFLLRFEKWLRKS
jgi:two-component system LytT family response regulator